MHPLKVLTLDEMTAKFVGSAELCNRELLRWNKFASLEKLYTVCRPLCAHEIRLLEGRAMDLGFYMPEAFPEESINPKFHYTVVETHRYATLMGTYHTHAHTQDTVSITHVPYQCMHRREVWHLIWHDERAVH
jgi:hypothetical protein